MQKHSDRQTGGRTTPRIPRMSSISFLFLNLLLLPTISTSLFSGLFGTKLPGEGCVYKSQNIRFKRAIYINDIVTAKVQVNNVDIRKKVIKFSTQCFVDNKVVIDGESEIFIP